MDWTQSKASYYSDFLLVPFLIGACIPYTTLWAVPVGFVAWTFTEYALHRWVFHWLTRRHHWMHHIRPTGYVAVSGLTTGLLHVTLMVTAFLTGQVGLFLGYEIGYYAYITIHDRMHHARPGAASKWLAWRKTLHETHHRGVEANFGVITSFWDQVFGTHCRPSEMWMWLAFRNRNRTR